MPDRNNIPGMGVNMYSENILKKCHSQEIFDGMRRQYPDLVSYKQDAPNLYRYRYFIREYTDTGEQEGYKNLT